MRKSHFILLVAAFLATALSGANIRFSDAASTNERVNPAANSGAILSYNQAISKAKKSVVNISTSRTVKTQNHMGALMNDPFFREFFGFHFRGMPESTRKSTSLGSGVIVSNDGYIVTNYHVIEDADEISVTLPDASKEHKAKVIGTDSKTDLAIIKIELNNLLAISFADSSTLLEGDVVFAIGNPFGVGGSVSKGIISGLNKDNIGLNQYEDFIQTDASINPGNSGGALIDSRGALVGINSAILSRSGGNNGIGFAIPSNMVKSVAAKLVKDGKISRGYIGVTIATLTEDQKEVYKSEAGALITNTEKDKPADKAGLKRGDLIIKINGSDIKSANDLKNTIGSLDPGANIKIEFERAGKIQSVSVKLASMEGEIGAKSSQIGGLGVENLTDENRSKYKIAKELKGVIITSIKEGSNAANAGFEVGDIIIQVNDKIVEDAGELAISLQNLSKNSQKPIIWINRGGAVMGLVLRF